MFCTLYMVRIRQAMGGVKSCRLGVRVSARVSLVMGCLNFNACVKKNIINLKKNPNPFSSINSGTTRGLVDGKLYCRKGKLIRVERRSRKEHKTHASK